MGRRCWYKWVVTQRYFAHNKKMKLIIGLGNPGEQYKNNRHNVGYMLIDRAKTDGRQNKNLVFVKSNIFMNSSGEVVRKLVKSNSTKIEDLYIVHDDLDIPLGSYKIQFGVGPKDHNGIKDIEDKLGTSDFWRVRIGVDNRNKDDRTPGEKYVLEDFSNGELEILDSAMEKCLKELYDKLQ